jgi:hypothetical protein
MRAYRDLTGNKSRHASSRHVSNNISSKVIREKKDSRKILGTL